VVVRKPLLLSYTALSRFHNPNQLSSQLEIQKHLHIRVTFRDTTKKFFTMGWFGYAMGWKMYPRAHENRIEIHDASFKKTRRAFMRAVFTNFFALQIVFLGLFSVGNLFEA
jgi:hypothetical protein